MAPTVEHWADRKYLDQPTTEKLVHSFISSRLDNMNCLLYGLPKIYLNKLKRVQYAAARLVTCMGRSDHMTPVLEKLHWLPINERIAYKLILITYKALHGLAPQYIADLLMPQNKSRTLRSTSKNLLFCPKSKSATYCDRRLCYIAPRLWNGLPESLKCADSLLTFKRELKTHLFCDAFNLQS